MKRINPLIVTTVLVLALALGGTVGFFFGRSTGSPDPSSEGQIDYACVLVRDFDERNESLEKLKEVGFQDPDYNTIISIAVLLGGGVPVQEGEASELGNKLMHSFQIFNMEQLETSFNEIREFCDAR